MSKRNIKIIGIAVLSVIVALELVYIAGSIIKKHGSGRQHVSGIVGTVSLSTKTAKINNTAIPAYNISGTEGLYFTNGDLALFGFECSENENDIVLSHPGSTYELTSEQFVQTDTKTAASTSLKKLTAGAMQYDCFNLGDQLLISSDALAALGEATDSPDTNTLYFFFGSADEIAAAKEVSAAEISSAAAQNAAPAYTPEMTIETSSSKPIIVLDPGHGKSSSLMSAEEKAASGWVQNSSGAWGEWRHYKIGSSTVDCEGTGCNGRVTPNGACWYPIGNSDRSTEPDINLKNALAAKSALEEKGYEVRMTRTTNDENPSITKRISYCYPNNDTSLTADAAMFVCIHSNAGGGSGSAYISLEVPYDQRGIKDTYAEDSNTLGKYINDSIISSTSLKMSGNGVISFEPELIAFCKSPVTCGYLEIGFFDNSSDLSILQSEYEQIGKAIADGIDKYYTETNQ